MGLFRLSAVIVACLAFAATGCVQKEFQDVKAQNIISAGPIHLEAEQVTLTNSQVDCGVQNDLWDPPSIGAGGGAAVVGSQQSIARLLQPGRDLHFSDDVIVSDPGFRQPYVQIRGDFMLQLADGPTIRDDGPDARIVEGRLMVLINHPCFGDPLPILGVRKGRFSQDANPVLRFELDNNGWHFAKLVH